MALTQLQSFLTWPVNKILTRVGPPFLSQNEDKQKWRNWFCCVVVTSVAICFWLLSFQLGGINGETSEGPLPTLFFPPLSSSSEVRLNLLSQFMVWLSKVQPGCLDKLFQSQKRKGRAAWHRTRGVLHVNNIYLFIVLCLFYFCTAFLTLPLLLFFSNSCFIPPNSLDFFCFCFFGLCFIPVVKINMSLLRWRKGPPPPPHVSWNANVFVCLHGWVGVPERSNGPTSTVKP